MSRVYPFRRYEKILASMLPVLLVGAITLGLLQPKTQPPTKAETDYEICLEIWVVPLPLNWRVYCWSPKKLEAPPEPTQPCPPPPQDTCDPNGGQCR